MIFYFHNNLFAWYFSLGSVKTTALTYRGKRRPDPLCLLSLSEIFAASFANMGAGMDL